MSSRGGSHSAWPLSVRYVRRAHGLCRHGKSTSPSFFTTYELDTLKWCFTAVIGIHPPSCARRQRARPARDETRAPTFFCT